MARAKITYTYNPQTGKREWHIDYQSPPDATAHEHESAHRKLVSDLVGDLESPDVEVERGDGRKPEPKPEDPRPPLPQRKAQ